MNDWILIIDFGSQYTKLIARRVRELSVYSEVINADLTEVRVALARNPAGIIISGSPYSVYDADYSQWKELFKPEHKILGICFGMQLTAHILGGKVIHNPEGREFGEKEVEIINDSKLFTDIPTKNITWMSHGDHVSQIPDDFEITAVSDSCPVVAMNHRQNEWYGVQFHPETTHSEYGIAMLKNFVVSVCGCRQSWTTESILDEISAEIKAQVGDASVLIAVSGGVDSTVSAVILHKILGGRLVPVIIDTGLLRLDEIKQVKEIFSNLNIALNVVDASEYFFAKLAGVSEPEEKRKVIGKCFIDKFEEFIRKNNPDIKFLAQGTIYPDIIESGAKSKHSETIKSHHNVGGLPDDLKLELVEPLKHLFKDEVRNVGKLLAIPAEFLNKHPFPGPGLGVRILGEVKPMFVKILQLADSIFIDELKKSGYYAKVSQAFCVFLPIKSVGVAGDSRKYSYVVSLRAVETIDFMSANFSRLDFDFLQKVSNRITNEIREISRVVYDISSKPPATIEWE